MQGNNFTPVPGMLTYIGTKISGAKPMNRQEYNDFRGWTLPADEEGTDAGYIVQYQDGYISWSPLEQFINAYRPTAGMPFGLAIEAMMQGHKVARTGWNGKGMFIIFVPGTKDIQFVDGSPYAKAVGSEPGQEILPHIDMWTINAEGRRAMLCGWLASQTDMLSDDWQIIE